MTRDNWIITGEYPWRYSWLQHYRPNFHSPSIYREILRVCQRCLHVFCRPWESLWRRCMGLTAACYWPSNHCIPAQKFIFLSAELNHNRSSWVLDFDKGVCCQSVTTPFHILCELGRQTQTRHCWKLQDQPLAFCERFVTVCILWTGSLICTWSVFCCMRPRRNENQH